MTSDPIALMPLGLRRACGGISPQRYVGARATPPGQQTLQATPALVNEAFVAPARKRRSVRRIARTAAISLAIARVSMRQILRAACAAAVAPSAAEHAKRITRGRAILAHGRRGHPGSRPGPDEAI
jgi:hypothetical protein